MKSIALRRSSGYGIVQFVGAITLLFTFIGQGYAAEESGTSKEEQGAFMGIYPTDLEKDDAEALDFKGEGILVEDIVDNGPAEKAGMEAGDIITAVDGVKITGVSQFRETLTKYKPGDKVKVSTIHERAAKEYAVELGKRKKIEYDFTFGKSSEKYGFLGVVTESIEGDFAKYFGVKEGALIKRIVEDSPAEKAGLKAGDVLLEVGGEEIEDTDDVTEAVRDHKPGDQIKVKYLRLGKEAEIEVKLTEWLGSADKMSKSKERSIIITTDDEVIVNTDELKRAIHEAMKEVQMYHEDSKESLRDEMEELKAEMEKFKMEMDARKKEIEKDKK